MSHSKYIFNLTKFDILFQQRNHCWGKMLLPFLCIVAFCIFPKVHLCRFRKMCHNVTLALPSYVLPLNLDFASVLGLDFLSLRKVKRYTASVAFSHKKIDLLFTVCNSGLSRKRLIFL